MLKKIFFYVLIGIIAVPVITSVSVKLYARDLIFLSSTTVENNIIAEKMTKDTSDNMYRAGCVVQQPGFSARRLEYKPDGLFP